MYKKPVILLFLLLLSTALLLPGCSPRPDASLSENDIAESEDAALPEITPFSMTLEEIYASADMQDALSSLTNVIAPYYGQTFSSSAQGNTVTYTITWMGDFVSNFPDQNYRESYCQDIIEDHPEVLQYLADTLAAVTGDPNTTVHIVYRNVDGAEVYSQDFVADVQDR